MIPLIAQPVGARAADRRREIGDNPVPEGRMHRPMEQGERDRAEQNDADPVEHGAHSCALHPRRDGRKRALGAMVACASLILASACEAPAPKGQVIANVDGTEITRRELATMLGDNEADAKRREEALDAIVARRVFAMEAEKRGLQRTGDFHFALRNARETLLMEALRRDISSGMEEPDEVAIDREIASHPWRYAARFVLTLAYPGQDEPAFAIDSATLAAAPGASLASAQPGDSLDYGGRRWRVLSREETRSDPSALRREAAERLKTSATEDELAAMIEAYRQGGQIRFQPGWGASADDLR